MKLLLSLILAGCFLVGAGDVARSGRNVHWCCSKPREGTRIVQVTRIGTEFQIVSTEIITGYHVCKNGEKPPDFMVNPDNNYMTTLLSNPTTPQWMKDYITQYFSGQITSNSTGVNIVKCPEKQTVTHQTPVTRIITETRIETFQSTCATEDLICCPGFTLLGSDCIDSKQVDSLQALIALGLIG